jgi:hypothetical protein
MCEDIRRILCGVCGGGGLMRVGQLCPCCEGEGYLPRLTIALPVVTARGMVSSNGRPWTRMAILSMNPHEGKIMAHGITDSSGLTTATLTERAFEHANYVVLAEREVWR